MAKKKARKKSSANFLFKPSDLFAECGLRHTELFRSSTKVQFMRQDNKGLQFIRIQIHAHSLSLAAQ